MMGGMPDRSSGVTPPPICGTQPPESAGVDALGVPEERISLPKWEWLDTKWSWELRGFAAMEAV